MSSEEQIKRDYDQTLLLKESALDLLGHFSTAAAILAGFFLTASIFLVSVNVERIGSGQYAFLDELIGDRHGIADAIRQALPANFVDLYWPTHFSYMLVIFIILFLMAMFSYACYIQAGLAHMKVLEGKTPLLDRVWFWQKWGLRILILDLCAAFITLPWAILRFAFEHALTWTLSLLCIVLFFGVLLRIGVKVARRRK